MPPLAEPVAAPPDHWPLAAVLVVDDESLTMKQVEAGALAARVGKLASGDEIGALAGHLDHLLDTLAAQTSALRCWNAELDAKVAERTQALEARSAELETAQAQLLRTGKLAAVGQLTASIAHEVNNPIAVIQGNLDLVRELLGETAKPVLAELKLVDQQIERMRLIVAQLLQFARPTEFAGYVEAVDCGRALADGLVLTGHLLARSRIRTVRDSRAVQWAGINRQALQPVLVNLLVNAIHAMPDGGTLTLATADWLAPGGEAGCASALPTLAPASATSCCARCSSPLSSAKKTAPAWGCGSAAAWLSATAVTCWRTTARPPTARAQ